METQSYLMDEIKAISYFSSSLYLKESVEEVLWDVTKNVIHRLGLVDCVIYTFNDGRMELTQHAAYGIKNPCSKNILNPIRLNLGEGIVGHVAVTKKAEIINDTSKDSRYIVDDTVRLSEICVPIIIDNILFGIIDSEHPQKGFYTEKHLHLLSIVAALCAQKIKEIYQKSRKPFTKDNQYFKQLKGLMRFDKIYRDPNLSLSSTAERLGISACYLSSLVNSLLNKSFIDFVNEYRIADVKRNLHAEAFNHYTILSVGLEAGFNSKSAFYSAFKKQTGITPLEFKKNNLVLSN
ncbi:helix-turn-helix domain-containing protein [Yeosuana marina]|uniref:helix-turn-helix domain-containing protein n=1 Tax=Yeosuana marina TaxID=1565536 RepID=UPI0030EBC837|tara:strand:- start:7745 stop:8623 length:879 start_codon:yes stop_codon:yes gene_type:complete